jgi:hypothetical protein
MLEPLLARSRFAGYVLANVAASKYVSSGQKSYSKDWLLELMTNKLSGARSHGESLQHYSVKSGGAVLGVRPAEQRVNFSMPLYSPLSYSSCLLASYSCLSPLAGGNYCVPFSQTTVSYSRSNHSPRRCHTIC